MPRIHFFVDGFNLYHALDARAGYKKYKWINLWKLCSCFVTTKDTLVGVEYFTTLATWNREKAERHKIFIRAQEAQGVSVIYGEFKRKDRKCRICNQTYQSFEEKQTDVNIALRLFQLAVQDRYDKAIIVSGDTDLIPAVKAVRSTFPSKQTGIVIPIGRASEDFKKQADFHYKMKEKHLQSSRFEDNVTLRDGTILSCPLSWR